MSNENGNGNHRNGSNNGHQRNGHDNGSVNGRQNGNGNHHVPANGVSRNGNYNGNGRHPDAADSIPAHDLLWDSLPASVTDKLAQPMDASLVSQRKGRGNRSFSYVEGRTVIDQANRIFGFGGWGHEVVGDVTLRDLDQVNPQTGEVKRIRAYSATVKVTVPGVPARTDVGFQPVSEETAEGHETAFKGAVTDALKRAGPSVPSLATPSTATWRASPLVAPGTPWPRSCARRCWTWASARASTRSGCARR